MTATASRLDLPSTLIALLQVDTAAPIDPPDHSQSAYRATTIDGIDAEIWVGRPGETQLGELWRRLGWLQGRTPAPRPIGFDVHDDVEALIVEPLAGRRAIDVEYKVDAVRTVGVIGAALARLHATDIDRCPFRIDSGDLAARAQRRLRALDPAAPGLDAALAHVTPDRVASIIADGAAQFATTDDPVLCHGRPTVDRFVLRDGEPVGFEGWEHSGVGDRYLDLAVLARNVATVLTPHLVPVLFDGYGLERPELARLDWFQLVDTVL